MLPHQTPVLRSCGGKEACERGNSVTTIQHEGEFKQSNCSSNSLTMAIFVGSLSSVCLKEAWFSTPAKEADVSTSRFSALQSALFYPILQLHFTTFARPGSLSSHTFFLQTICSQSVPSSPDQRSTATPPVVLLSVLTGVDSSAPFHRQQCCFHRLRQNGSHSACFHNKG